MRADQRNQTKPTLPRTSSRIWDADVYCKASIWYNLLVFEPVVEIIQS